MDQSILLKIARESIEEVVLATRTIDKKELLRVFPVLNEKIATFVTINLDGKLRGCIGSLVAQKTLLNDIIHNAKSAAFEDPRFTPITTSEYLHCSIEISLLSEPKELVYTDVQDLKESINVGKDGVILILGEKNSTFLPQVWSQLKTFEEFFAGLCLKADLEESALSLHPQIYTYYVETIEDEPKVKTEL
ncbi:MAG: AmmeMemoRadiSam system protein A [Helicobacteraceae bacterium]|nr:AmmeMemoRadiSam system protein A [Helicobacteraceae bacterium]